MEREQIIKALKTCAITGACSKCPYHMNRAYCNDALMKDAHALILELIEENGKLHLSNRLLKSDVAEVQEQLERKLERVYPEFMRDYKCMRCELDGAYDEIEELKKERVKQGFWEYGNDHTARCSVCGNEEPCHNISPFCPICGAHLGIEEDE